jgi:quercetin dioxygenase-like cupin family protein
MKLRFDEVAPIEVIAGHIGRFIQTDRMTFVLWNIEEGAKLPEHSHDNEQVVHVLAGDYLLTVDGKEHHLKAGDVFQIRGNELHLGKALTPCRILDTFSPRRDDYSSYARGKEAA